MPILMPEKTILAGLAAGLQTIKTDLTIVDDVFETEILGADYLTKVKTYLAENKIYLGLGHSIKDTKLPAWYVIPARVSSDEQFPGAFVADEAVDDLDVSGDIIEGEYHRYNTRVITASGNGDVSMFLEAIARYILIQSQTWAEENGLMELTAGATDFDPIYQYLPEHLFYRSTLLDFRGLSTWKKTFPIIRDTELFAKFDPNENFIEI